MSEPGATLKVTVTDCRCDGDYECGACEQTRLIAARRDDCSCTAIIECPEHFQQTMQRAKAMGARDFVSDPWGKDDFLELARLLASGKQDTMTLDPKTLRDMCAVLVDIIDEQAAGNRALTRGAA